MEMNSLAKRNSDGPENRSGFPGLSEKRVYTCPADYVHQDPSSELRIPWDIPGTLFLRGYEAGIKVVILDISRYSFRMATPIAIPVHTSVQVAVADANSWGEIWDCRPDSECFRADVRVHAFTLAPESEALLEEEERAYFHWLLEMDLNDTPRE
jgi:hypothetical protein